MLTLSMAAAALSNFMGSVYVVTKKSAASFWTSLVGATANVLLNLWLIPWLGIQGAAATFFSCLAVFLIRLVNARLLLPFPLSGKKLALGVGALTVQTGWLLLGLPGGLLVQGGKPVSPVAIGRSGCAVHRPDDLSQKVGVFYDRNCVSRLLHGPGRQRPRRLRRDHRVHPGLLRALSGRPP